LSDYLKRSWAVVDLDRLSHNIDLTKRLIKTNALFMAVVKADAYGHGDAYCARTMAQSGADWFGVSNIIEALSLRAQGMEQPILIFGYTPVEHAITLAEHRLTQTVFSLSYGQALQQAAESAGVTIDIHIKVDSGMSRLGFTVDEPDVEPIDSIERIYRCANLNAEGIYSHFACADELNAESIAYTREQFDRFLCVIDRLKDKGVNFKLRHCCNSAATLNYPDMHLDMVRCGIVLYGLTPNSGYPAAIDLKPIMSLHSIVSMVKQVAPNRSIGYGRSHITGTTRRIATVPIGYADGYSRLLSNRARVLINGEFANVIGRISMDRLMIDVSHLNAVAPGDSVTLVGDDGEQQLTFDELARLSETNGYEKVCLIGKRVPRVYRQNGQEIGAIDLFEQQIDRLTLNNK
jgi:alanine racemase